ncbi:hypothetical protein H4J58_16950 [Colwellia sp. MB3u-70]|uniref:hydrogen gas-evolving membrane-bound hydrogenase subunit E n=1 Tax=unclassified Colwellia TaxID=196834 RepID=UPI0015F4D117|nr:MULTISPECIES: hydrogen gas-evolving membrane-bound hydrogenase subunit E [unclassified Colwellia]MBA6292725.1 hypothetical protein [Colwellia sp. MB3u-8]MBA6308803.1 hypothetical protein [Colwellia sp. MB3u-70]
MFNKLDIEYDGPAVNKSALSLIASVLVTGLLLAVTITIVLSDKGHNTGLASLITQNIELSGVTNPVTAVLLNFRAYDTLLEIAVLLVVVLAILPTRDHHAPFFKRIEVSKQNLVLLTLQRWITPAVVIFAGYLLWAGAHQPGGAFQAGALLAGASVLMFQSDTYQVNYTSFMARVLLVLSLVVFLTIGTALIWFEGSLLTYPLAFSGLLILLIEACATVSITLALASLYSSFIASGNISVTDHKHRTIK